MPSLTVFSTAADGFIQSDNPVYAVARSGGTLASFGTQPWVGQTTNGADFRIWEAFLSFDTSAIPDSAIIDSVVLSLDGTSDSSTQDFTVEARLFDWGSSLTTADWVPGANLAALPLLASYPTASGWGTGYIDLASEAAFAANVNKAGETRMVICSSRTRAGTPNIPGTAEAVRFNSSEATGTGEDPKLVIAYTEVSRRALMGVG